VDIYEVNLTHLATQFIEHIDTMRMLDLEIAGEFLVMAATLMSSKAAVLPVVSCRGRGGAKILAGELI
jgi:segregation and condensation protein A